MSTSPEFRAKIKATLETVNSAEKVYELFKVLEYPENIIFEQYSKRDISDFGFNKEDREKVRNIYTVMSFGQDLPVFLLEGNFGVFTSIRSLVSKFDEKYLRYLLILTKDYKQIAFVFPQHEELEPGKKRLKIVKLILTTSELFWTDIETVACLKYPGKGKTYRDVWMLWKSAFDVSKVTDKFFKGYTTVFDQLCDDLETQKLDRKDAHAFALQFLSRLMFIYFISKKAWLNNDFKFLRWFWQGYQKELRNGNESSDNFYEKWLKQLFFKAFNNNSNQIKNLPEDVKEVISNFPFLNGGLFTENECDQKFNEKRCVIRDEMFQTVFNFYESYNFTIKEDMPLEQEVAVDPQMIGYVYESLANVAEEIYDRKDLGIFYTPRAEVDFMCKQTLVEYLSKQLPDVPKKYFYIFVFDEDCKEAELYFKQAQLWDELEAKLNNLDVIDPACGSGAFLVGMLNVLTALYRVIFRHVDRPYAKRDSTYDYRIKHRIIMNTLYGVDVMSWAVRSAELRLWLQMIIESEINLSEYQNRPLLPNLDLNLRIGDSLVQEIGGIQFNLRDLKPTADIKKQLDDLSREKDLYFKGFPDKFDTKEKFFDEESRIFKMIVKDKIDELKKDKKKIEKLISQASEEQLDLIDQNGKKHESEIEKLDIDLKLVSKNIDSLNNVLKNLEKTGKRDFVWEIDFAEIFGDKGGFDIVMGNPPYVRQENISPPNRTKAEVEKVDRDEYKDKLRESVLIKFPQLSKIDRKSDYYIYFYYHGLSLLNEKGTFCFITSNSWLDVGYGAGFQEFLLKYAPIIGIYDCNKRSFEHADINTVITVLSAPSSPKNQYEFVQYKSIKNWYALSHRAKFVLFKKPFELILSSKIQLEIENVTTIKEKGNLLDLVANLVHSDYYRVFPILHEDLLEDGWEYPDEELKTNIRFTTGKYIGNKWGRKFINAPDIYYSCLNKGKNLFVSLKSLFEFTQRNTLEIFNTIEVLNENYMMNNNLPYLSSVKEVSTINVNIKSLPKCIKKDKRKKYDYIIPDIISNRFIGEKFIFYEGGDFLVGDTFFVGILLRKNIKWKVLTLLNSTITFLFAEILGRANLGGGLLTIYGPEFNAIPIIDPDCIKGEKETRLKKIYDKIKGFKTQDVFSECGISLEKDVRSQQPDPSTIRKEIDNFLFDILAFSKHEKKEIYWSLCEMVKARLEKAKTFKKKKR